MTAALEPRTMAPAIGLRAESLCAGYRGREVVHQVDLVLRPGAVHGLIGPNGAGKSTLLRAMAGIAPVTGGRVLTAEGPMDRMGARHRARTVAYLSQDTSVEAGLRAGTVVSLGRYAHRSPLARLRGDLTREDQEIVHAALERVGAAALRDRPVDQLSGGQRVLVAKQLAQQSRVLLLDEPVSALDLGFQMDVLDLVRELAAEGRTIAVVLHDLNLAARACDQLTLLQDGRVLASGEPVEVLRPEVLSKAYGVRTTLDIDPATARPRVTVLGRAEPAVPTHE
jgi:iron complex transport system ATP-binding protein